MKDSKFYKDLLKVFEQKSTCKRLKVACLIVRDGRIVSTGWNGVASKAKHCCDMDWNDKTFMEDHRIFSKDNEIHAEMNAIAFAAKNGISTNNCVLYCSYSPCIDCAKVIVNSGIKEVYFDKIYDRSSGGYNYLLKNNIVINEI